MILKKLEVEAWSGHFTNCYIVADEVTKEAMVVDPGNEANKIIDMINILNVKLKYIVLTHCHADHVMGIPELKEKLGGTVVASRIESDLMNTNGMTLFANLGLPVMEINVDSRVDDNDVIHLGNIEFKVITTPGHTIGSICLYCAENKLLFSGDTLFSGAWGRTDLPTSSFEDIIASISNKLMILPEDTIVYPGHGKPTMISEEEKIYLGLKPKKW